MSCAEDCGFDPEFSLGKFEEVDKKLPWLTILSLSLSLPQRNMTKRCAAILVRGTTIMREPKTF